MSLPLYGGSGGPDAAFGLDTALGWRVGGSGRPDAAFGLDTALGWRVGGSDAAFGRDTAPAVADDDAKKLASRQSIDVLWRPTSALPGQTHDTLEPLVATDQRFWT